jgi:Smg protein
MFDILVYVFENCRQADLAQDSELVARKLSAAGFEETDISEALRWLGGVMKRPQRVLAPLPDSRIAFRAYAPRELAKLDAECLGFLMYLEGAAIIDSQTREHVLERALAAGDGELSLEQLKLIVLMVMWNQRMPASRLIAEDLRTAHAHRLPS